MKIKFTVLIILLSSLCVSSLTAQKNNKKIVLSGTVLDASKAPIVNAIVMIDNEKTNSVTDANGKYKVRVKPTAEKIGIFTFGHGVSEQLINGRGQIDFNFGASEKEHPAEQNIASGDQGVNTGYGLVKKKNLTTDVNKIDGTNKKYASYKSIGDMIQREVSGVRLKGSSVIIQDSKDFFGNVYALIIVDGVSMDELPDIPPYTVQSIEVLKGTSAAIYGSRGYGGVIIIKTKIQND
jgi:TonB-dependent starch-binding outer membrane protein SusC